MQHKIKHIYINGDSYAFGQELGGSDVPPKDFYIHTDYMKGCCYGGLIQQHYNIPNYTNSALPGGSNDRTFRETVTAVSQLLTTNSPEELFVLIAFTEPSRREFFDIDSNKYDTYLNNSRPTENQKYLAMWDIYTAHFDDVREAATRYMIQIVTLQTFLTQLQIPHLLTYSLACPAISNSYYKLPIDATVSALINKKTCPDLEFHGFMHDIAGRNPQINYYGSRYHPLEEGHKLWAKRLIEHIDENNLLVVA